MAQPLALSDSELEAVPQAARPLPIELRDGFLQEVAASLRACGEIGLAPCIGFAPRRSGRFLIRPDLSRSRDVSRWRRWLTSKVGCDRACGFRYVTTYARHHC